MCFTCHFSLQWAQTHTISLKTQRKQKHCRPVSCMGVATDRNPLNKAEAQAVKLTVQLKKSLIKKQKTTTANWSSPLLTKQTLQLTVQFRKSSVDVEYQGAAAWNFIFICLLTYAQALATKKCKGHEKTCGRFDKLSFIVVSKALA